VYHSASSEPVPLMDGSSCCLEGKPVVTSGDNSPTSAAHAGLPLPIEKRCASVDKTCEAAEGGNGLLETKICTCFSKAISLEVKKGLQKCATFPPSSAEAQLEDHSCCHADDGHTAAPAYERSVSLPVSTSSLTVSPFFLSKMVVIVFMLSCMFAHVLWVIFI
jgi:hypothetical protein